MVLRQLFATCVLCTVLLATDVSTNDGTTFSIYEVSEQIRAEGYQAETHHVTTSDGYILEMHRIPYGRSSEPASEDRPVVFLMHGLLSSSQAFISIGPEYSIAYNLADAGFDVWMGNARGTKNSRFHVTLNPDDEEEKFQFFDFSFEEIGLYDLPAMIDYILDYTKKDNLHYIGHSQGGTVFLVMASMRPEYNEKLVSVHLLAGVGYQTYFPDNEIATLATMTESIYEQALNIGAVELYPPNSMDMVPDALLPLSDYCLGSLIMRQMCQLFGIGRIRSTLTTYNAATDQPGAAIKQVAHYGQNIRDKLFRRFHYGDEENQALYGSTQPPNYDLSLITSYVTMHFTLADNLLDPRDVYAMMGAMPKAVARTVGRDSFAHEDFTAATDAKELVTDYIIDVIKFLSSSQGPIDDSVNVVDNNPDEINTTSSTVILTDITTSSPTDSTSDSTTVSDDKDVEVTDPDDASGAASTTAAPEAASTTAAPEATTVTGPPGGAATIALNVYLVGLSLYVILN